jgi:hypothetical protein
MAFTRRRENRPNETALVEAIDAKLARLAPALRGSRPDQAELVLRWLNELLDQRIEVTRTNGESEAPVHHGGR